MPYKTKICGIYRITTPNGSEYVGSSVNIYSRWAQHRGGMRSGKHRSPRLQSAWNKHGKLLAFSILEECERDALNQREQYWIDALSPVLNTHVFVANPWSSPTHREKMAELYASSAWKERTRESFQKRAEARQIPVMCSDGRLFPSLGDAALAFGCTSSHIRYCAQNQRVGKLKVRFRYTGEPWREVVTASQARWQSRVANGTTHPSRIRPQVVSA